MIFSQFDSITKQIMDAFGVPSVVAACSVDGETHICSYGCDENTLFAVGSCTKSFVAGTILALQDRGRLSVDDPIIRYIPDFAVSDPETAKSLTIRDILSHRSGFPGCDIAWYSRHDNFMREDLMKAISLLPQTANVGEKHQYNNMMFSLAGEIIEKAAGTGWKEAVTSLIFSRLGIEKAAFDYEEAMLFGPVAVPSILSDIGSSSVPHARLGSVSPSGCLYMTAGELLKWNIAILNGGGFKGEKVLSSAAIREMTSPQVSEDLDGLFPEFTAAVHNRNYALGLQTESFHGEKLIFHGGAIDGFLANQNILPGRNCASVLLTNLSGTFAREAFQYAFNGLLLGDEIDWIEKYAGLQEKMMNEYGPLLHNGRISGDYEKHTALAGRYTNPLFGELVLSSESSHFTASIGNIAMPVISVEDTVSFFHPEFGLLQTDCITDSSGKITALAISAAPEINMKFRFTRK